MSIRCGNAWVCFSLVLLAGCGISEQQKIEKTIGGQVKKVVPVSGTITVDGAPQKGVFVSLYNAEGTAKVEIEPPCTDKEGKFAFTTYRAGDGIPPGDYTVTFEWLKVKNNGETEYPDKLNKRYSKPQDSKEKLNLVEGQPKTDLKYELTTK